MKKETCIEMHCSGAGTDHDYGDPVCDWVWDSDHEILYGKNEAPTNREAFEQEQFDRRPNPADRWNTWQKHNDENDNFQNTAWARRGDGALMLQDQHGWFAMVTDADGTIYTESADATDRLHDTNSGRFDVYCEPIWLSWAADAEMARDDA